MMRNACKRNNKSLKKTGELLFEIYEERMSAIYKLSGQEIKTERAMFKGCECLTCRCFVKLCTCLLTKKLRGQLFGSINVSSKKQIN
jgi:hypothetical protein